MHYHRMKSSSRISSILNAKVLGSSITNFESFSLSQLNLLVEPNFELPTNLRLGHLAEKCVAELIKASGNYDLLHENIQIVQGNNTIGELDFIVQEIETKEIIHVEVAYKFYLLDPSISEDPIKNWIGPNRNDSLHEKLVKLKKKQFPLLYQDCTSSMLPDVDVDNLSQALCFMAALYVPIGFEGGAGFESPSALKESKNLKSSYSAFQDAIRGYYLDFDTFRSLHDSASTYHLPTKTAWGMHPGDHKEWSSLSKLEQEIQTSLEEQRAVLVWKKSEEVYSSFFVVWW
jgi:hypothetical protein